MPFEMPCLRHFPLVWHDEIIFNFKELVDYVLKHKDVCKECQQFWDELWRWYWSKRRE